MADTGRLLATDGCSVGNGAERIRDFDGDARPSLDRGVDLSAACDSRSDSTSGDKSLCGSVFNG
jgi:hypothetical protein